MKHSVETRHEPVPTAKPVPPVPAAPVAPVATAETKPSKPAPVAVEAKPAKQAEPAKNGKAVSGIQVQEMAPVNAAEVEEAVMLYANGRVGEAASALNRYLLDNPESRDEQPWQLLFDLYEATDQRQQFEELALDYAMRLELSPPTWQVRRAKEGDKPSAKRPVFVFAPSLVDQGEGTLELWCSECKSADAVTLDFSRIASPNDAYATRLLDMLTSIQACAAEIKLSGGEAFLVRLDAAKSAGRLGQPGWLLQLQLLQMLGKAETFDEVALDYAVKFEISPPSYVPPRHFASNEEPTAGGPGLSGSGELAFQLHGILAMESVGQLEALRHFAEPLRQVTISLAQVPRIDFMAVGLVADLVMSLAKMGKRVEFVEGNGLVNLLLQMAGIGQYATLRSEKRK